MNLLQSGMIFKNSVEASKFLGYKNNTHTNQNLQRLSHYCEYIRNEKNEIIVTKVFDEPIPFKTLDFRYSIGDIVNTKNSTFKILDRFRKNDSKNHRTKLYKCQCLKDNYVFEIRESRITSMNIGCPICGGKKLIQGHTSLYDKYPELLIYLVNEEDAKSVTCGSNKKILCKCPTCSCLKEMSVHNLVNYGFSCPVCSDGISYPNKFMRKFLSQLDIDFISEKSFSWSDGRLYDIFIPSINIIIENHGIQHYSEINGIFNDLEYEKRNDKYKRNLALDNNIEHYIEIDCRKSDKDFIKNSIMNSQLPKLLNFCEKDIDWEECDLFSNTPFLESICKTWNNNKNITDVCNELNLNCSTVRKYLQIGAKYGLCDYYNNIYTSDNRKRSLDYHCKPIYCEDLNIYFYSSVECHNYFKKDDETFNGKCLYQYINNNRPYHNKKFVYISKEKYNNQKEKSLVDDSIVVIGDYYNNLKENNKDE